MSEIKEARAARGPYRKLKHLVVSKGKGGGHIVEHHYEQSAGGYHEHESKPFGQDEGEAMLAHVGRHMGVKGADSEKEPQQERASSEGHEQGPADQDTEGL